MLPAKPKQDKKHERKREKYDISSKMVWLSIEIRVSRIYKKSHTQSKLAGTR